MNILEHEAQSICTRLFHGWAEKEELPLLASDPAIYQAVQEKLAWLGLELVDRSDCPWYMIRLMQEHDSFSQYRRRNRHLQGRHYAMILILYSKLLLPKRAGLVGPSTDLSISLLEIYENYGRKFIPPRKKVATEASIKTLLQNLVSSGFIVKKRSEEIYEAGPAMYMLHDDLLTDIAESSLQILFGIDLSNEEPHDTDTDEEEFFSKEE
jgi:hypothetical protein